MKKLGLLLVAGAMLWSFTTLAWAGVSTTNYEGGKDGKYRVQFEDNSTRERSTVYEAKVEGYFLTVYYPDGAVTYKINEMYDRRTELEVSVYDTKQGRYVTAHLDDGTHVFHKETQDLRAQQREERKKKRQEKILARKKKLAASPTPSPDGSSVPSATPSPSASPEN